MQFLSQDYQLISNYISYREPLSNYIMVNCDAIKLKNEMRLLKEDINLPFVNDENVLDRQKLYGFSRTKEVFSPDNKNSKSCYFKYKEMFSPDNKNTKSCYFKYIEFLKNGSCIHQNMLPNNK